MPPRDPICPLCGEERPYRKKYCVACKEKQLKKQAKAYRESDKGKAKFKYHLITGRYGLTVQQYEAMILKQNGVCSICQESNELTVDHDHGCCPGIESCGECVRGLLCGKCNRGLGLFNDNVDRLDSAILYLLERR